MTSCYIRSYLVTLYLVHSCPLDVSIEINIVPYIMVHSYPLCVCVDINIFKLNKIRGYDKEKKKNTFNLI